MTVQDAEIAKDCLRKIFQSQCRKMTEKVARMSA